MPRSHSTVQTAPCSVRLSRFACCPTEGRRSRRPIPPRQPSNSCSFGMTKGDPTHQCQVPIPAGCVTAHFPGTKKPWTTVSKAGRTFCKFDEKATDWKTRIIGPMHPVRFQSVHRAVYGTVRLSRDRNVLPHHSQHKQAARDLGFDVVGISALPPAPAPSSKSQSPLCPHRRPHRASA